MYVNPFSKMNYKAIGSLRRLTRTADPEVPDDTRDSTSFAGLGRDNVSRQDYITDLLASAAVQLARSSFRNIFSFLFYLFILFIIIIGYNIFP